MKLAKISFTKQHFFFIKVVSINVYLTIFYKLESFEIVLVMIYVIEHAIISHGMFYVQYHQYNLSIRVSKSLVIVVTVGRFNLKINMNQ